ncbi:MAG: Hsp70 family protein [Actinobacteria bacterium]|nr:Hsp70 family protein [Actinomycetota bacterium]
MASIRWLREGIRPAKKIGVSIGIDLGTTNSSAAFYDPRSNTVRVIPVSMGLTPSRMPSVVAFDEERDRILYGDDAEQFSFRFPDYVVREFKRDMPSASSKIYRIGTGERVRTETPVTLSSMMLTELRRQVLRVLTDEFGDGIKIENVVVTVPANYPEEAQQATKRAAETAGFTDVSLLSEPEAAALTYSEMTTLRTGAQILVFDFGGGTLDCCLLRRDHGGRLHVSHANGDPNLGGKDFDEALIRWVADRVAIKSALPPPGVFDVLGTGDIGISIARRKKWRQEIRNRSVDAKISLSMATSFEIVFDNSSLVDYDGTPLLVEDSITRADFEHLTRSHVDRALAVFDATIREAGLEPDAIDRVIMVGGSSNIPTVGEAIRARTGLDPVRTIDPLTAVAQGAAIWAERISRDRIGRGTGEGLVMVSNHNFGVRIGFGQLEILIPKNRELPVETEPRTYRPATDGATNVDVPLYQFSEELVTRSGTGPVTVTHDDIERGRAYEIGRVQVDGLSGANRFIDVKFTMDRNRIG